MNYILTFFNLFLILLAFFLDNVSAINYLQAKSYALLSSILALLLLYFLRKPTKTFKILKYINLVTFLLMLFSWISIISYNN